MTASVPTPSPALLDVHDHLAQAREIIEGKGRGSSFAPETTTVGQVLLALEDLAQVVAALDQQVKSLTAEVARVRNRLLEQEAGAGAK